MAPCDCSEALTAARAGLCARHPELWREVCDLAGGDDPRALAHPAALEPLWLPWLRAHPDEAAAAGWPASARRFWRFAPFKEVRRADRRQLACKTCDRVYHEY